MIERPIFELSLLGPTELRRADGSDASALLAQPRILALLSYLAAAGPKGAYHRRDRIVGLFWPESGQEQARANLRKLVHVLR